MKHRYIQVGTLTFAPKFLGITPIPCSPSGPAKWGTPGPGAQGALKLVRGCPTCRGASGDPRHPFQACTPRPCPVAFVHLESAWARTSQAPCAHPSRAASSGHAPAPRPRPSGLLLGAAQTGEPRATPPGQWEAAAPGCGAWPDDKGRGRPCPTPSAAPDLGPKLGPGFA